MILKKKSSPIFMDVKKGRKILGKNILEKNKHCTCFHGWKKEKHHGKKNTLKKTNFASQGFRNKPLKHAFISTNNSDDTWHHSSVSPEHIAAEKLHH